MYAEVQKTISLGLLGLDLALMTSLALSA